MKLTIKQEQNTNNKNTMTDKKHTPETIFVKVFCKDRLPAIDISWILTDFGVASYSNIGFELPYGFIVEPEWWLEEIPNPLAGIDNPAEWVAKIKMVHSALGLNIDCNNLDFVNAFITKIDELQAENERLKKEIAEWELFSKAANESIKERNESIAHLKKTALKALETIKVDAEEYEFECDYSLKNLIWLCDKFIKEIKGE